MSSALRAAWAGIWLFAAGTASLACSEAELRGQGKTGQKPEQKPEPELEQKPDQQQMPEPQPEQDAALEEDDGVYVSTPFAFAAETEEAAPALDPNLAEDGERAPPPDSGELPPPAVTDSEIRSVSRTYHGGCIGVRHGGSAAAANRMNRQYVPQFEAACIATLDLGRDFAEGLAGRGKITIKFRNGHLPQNGSAYADGSVTTGDPAFRCMLDEQGPTWGEQTVTISALEKSYRDSHETIGNHDKGGKWAVAYDPATRKLYVGASKNGFGKCRFNGRCGACLEGAVVTLSKD